MLNKRLNLFSYNKDRMIKPISDEKNVQRVTSIFKLLSHNYKKRITKITATYWFGGFRYIEQRKGKKNQINAIEFERVIDLFD